MGFYNVYQTAMGEIQKGTNVYETEQDALGAISTRNGTRSWLRVEQEPYPANPAAVEEEKESEVHKNLYLMGESLRLGNQEYSSFDQAYLNRYKNRVYVGVVRLV